MKNSDFEIKRKSKFKNLVSNHMKKIKSNNQSLDKKFYDELEILNNKNKYTTQELKRINEENYQIIKDNRLIQKSTFDFTELELKCLNYTLSKLKPNISLSENDWVEYKLKDLIKMLNLKDSSASVQLIKKSLRNLRVKGKWVKIETDKIKKEIDLSFFLKCEIENVNGENVVKVRFMQEILDYLQNLHKNFTSQYLIYSIRLKGKYAIRLYELCKSYQQNFIKELKIYGFNFYIDKMKTKWCLNETYTNAEIKRILQKAIDEINSKTDIKISIYNTHKDGKKVDYYIIKIEPSHNFAKIFEDIKKERKV